MEVKISFSVICYLSRLGPSSEGLLRFSGFDPVQSDRRFRGVVLSDVQTTVSIRRKLFDNFPVHVLVRYDFHRWTYSIGYTTSAPSTSAANAMAARMPSSVRRGCAARICSTVSPAASFSRISSTRCGFR